MCVVHVKRKKKLKIEKVWLCEPERDRESCKVSVSRIETTAVSTALFLCLFHEYQLRSDDENEVSGSLRKFERFGR